MFSYSTYKCHIEHVASNITTRIQNGVLLHGHKPGNIVTIRKSTQRQLSAVRQSRLLSDAAAVVLWNVSKNHWNRSSSILLLQIIISAKWTEWNWRIYCFTCVSVRPSVRTHI